MSEKDSLAVRLEKLKERQDSLKVSKARLEGRRAQLLHSLQEQFGVSSLEEGEEKLQSLRRDLDRRRTRVDRLLTQLETLAYGNK